MRYLSDKRFYFLEIETTIHKIAFFPHLMNLTDFSVILIHCDLILSTSGNLSFNLFCHWFSPKPCVRCVHSFDGQNKGWEVPLISSRNHSWRFIYLDRYPISRQCVHRKKKRHTFTVRWKWVGEEYWRLYIYCCINYFSANGEIVESIASVW